METKKLLKIIVDYMESIDENGLNEICDTVKDSDGPHKDNFFVYYVYYSTYLRKIAQNDKVLKQGFGYHVYYPDSYNPIIIRNTRTRKQLTLRQL